MQHNAVAFMVQLSDIHIITMLCHLPSCMSHLKSQKPPYFSVFCIWLIEKVNLSTLIAINNLMGALKIP